MRDIWGFYNYKGRGAAGSTVVHLLALAAIIGATYLGRKMIEVAKPKETVLLIAPDDLPVLPASATRSGGGGGGGDRDKLQASAGRLPTQSRQQITPPMVVQRNPNPKLEVPPTIVAPTLPQPSLADLGDPLSHLPSVPSNGTGSGGGIGSGSGGGVGSGEGPGLALVTVAAPVAAHTAWAAEFPLPRRSIRRILNIRRRRARRSIRARACCGCGWPGRKARDIRVARTLGLGLDEKAIEAVKNWRFEPGMKDGKPVATQVNVEVTFRLY